MVNARMWFSVEKIDNDVINKLKTGFLSETGTSVSCDTEDITDAYARWE
jgi:hypothetical protein